MRWFAFILLTIVLLVLQSTVAPRIAIFGVRPDWLLIAVVFYALHTPPREAAIAAWTTGAMADLMSIERFGLVALSYLLVAIPLVSAREYLFRYKPVTQVLVGLLACLVVHGAWEIYNLIMYTPARSIFFAFFAHVLPVSLYTAIWTPILHAGLIRLSGALGIARPRYSYAGLHRLGSGRV